MHPLNHPLDHSIKNCNKIISFRKRNNNNMEQQQQANKDEKEVVSHVCVPASDCSFMQKQLFLGKVFKIDSKTTHLFMFSSFVFGDLLPLRSQLCYLPGVYFWQLCALYLLRKYVARIPCFETLASCHSCDHTHTHTHIATQPLLLRIGGI